MMTKPTLPDVIGRFRAYHEQHPIWGALHIVLADGNVGTRDVEFCLQWAEERGDAEGAELARILLTMSRTQRYKLGRLA